MDNRNDRLLTIHSILAGVRSRLATISCAVQGRHCFGKNKTESPSNTTAFDTTSAVQNAAC